MHWSITGRLLIALLLLAGGCQSQGQASSLSIEGTRYDAAFEAAANVLRRHDLSPVLADRRGGVIATDPSPAPTLLEPWRWGGAGDASLENTLSARRRRARVEFQPASFTAAPDHGERLEGPDLLHMASPEQDLTRSSDEALLLRVWVYLEEADTVGAQRSAWTRERSARAVVLEDDGTGRATVTTAVRWRVIARDGEVERKLLRDIEKELAMADARDGRR